MNRTAAAERRFRTVGSPRSARRAAYRRSIPEVLNQGFEPFFTTKPVGKESGLGLRMVFGFSSQSGGHVAIDSRPGCGTTVRIFLPRSEDVRDEPAAVEDLPTGHGRGQSVLIVEDNATLRAAASRHLVALGYRTIEAEDGETALAVLEAGGVDLVFGDVVMHGDISGFDLARIVTARWPSVRVVLTSGYRDAVPRTAPSDPAVVVLAKPFRRSELDQVIRQALAASEPVVGS